MLPSGSRVEYFRRGIITRRWHFRLVAPNNEIIASSMSKGYTSKSAMMDTIGTYFPQWNLVPHDSTSN